MSITIRPYQKADKQALLDILQLNVPTYFGQEEVEDLSIYLDQYIDLYYVALDEDLLIGAAGINRNTDAKTASLSWGFLHPDYHRKGVGTQLLQYRLAILKQEKDIQTIQVRTSQVVYKFFEKHNFETIEIQKNYWAKGLDLYVMRLK